MVESHYTAAMLQWDNMFQMEAEGLISRARVESHIANIAPFYFGSAYGKHWWSLQEPGWKETPMFDVAGPIVDAVDPDFLETYFNTVRTIPAGSIQSVDDEARGFMSAYAEELRTGNRAAIAECYARSGAVIILNGIVGHVTQEALAAHYSSDWTPPQSFAWVDLSFQPMGRDAVSVTGQFRWGTDANILPYSYTGLLKRDDGILRIVLENEIRIDVPAP